MSTYTYTRHAILGTEIKSDTKSLSAFDVYREMGQSNVNAFHMLINRWNRQGLLGVPNGGPVYVYTVD